MNAREGTLFAGALVPSISIDNLLGQRAGILQLVANAIATLGEAGELAKTAGITEGRGYHGFPWMLAGEDHYQRTNLLDEDAIAQIRKRVDAAAWDHLLSASGMRTLMDTKARKEWDDKIQKLECPELTKENVQATFGAMYQSRDEIFERGVLNVFKELSWDYKTNQPFKFGKRIVVRLSYYGTFDHERTSKLEDLQRVFCLFDGKPEEDHRSGLYSRLYSAQRLEGGRTATRGELDDVYMQVRWFKNGNGHVTFKRPDLVEKMNQILAKHYPGALPAPRD